MQHPIRWPVVWRLAVVAGVALIVFVHTALSIQQKLFNRSINGLEGFYCDLLTAAPELKVQHVPERFRDGSPNPAWAAGVKVGDVIVAIEDPHGAVTRIESLIGYGQTLRRLRPGETWAVFVARPGAQADQPLRLPIGPVARVGFNWQNYLQIVGFIVLLPVLGLVAAVLIGFARPGDANARRASMMFFGFVTMLGINPETLPAWAIWLTFTVRCFGPALGAYFLVSFALSFPSRSVIDERAPWLRRILLGLVLLLALYEFVVFGAMYGSFQLTAKLLARTPGWLPTKVDELTFYLFAAMFALSLFGLAWSLVRNPNPDERRRLRLILVGVVVTFVPLIALLISRALLGRDVRALHVLCTGTVWAFPLLFVYAVVRHQVFGIRLILRRGLQYALVTRGVFFLGVGLFALIYFALGPWASHLIPTGGEGLASVGAAGLAIGLAMGLREVNRRVMPAIDRRFFRDAYDARRILSELADAVRQLAAEPERLLMVVADQLHAALHPTAVLIFLRRDEAGRLCPEAEARSGAGEPARAAPGEHAPAAASEYCCAVISPSPKLALTAAQAPAIARGAALPTPGALADLLNRMRGQAPRMIDVLPALDAPWDRRSPPADAVRLDQLHAERPLLESLPARLVVPLVASRRVVGFVVLGAKLSEEPYTREDRELLLAVAGQTATALDYAQLIDQLAERERLRRELEIAQEVQGQLFPQARPQLETLRYTGVSQPALILGGDYYDFMRLGPHRLGLALADLSGKGIPAALLMATVQGALRSHAPEWGDRLADLAADINTQLRASSAPNRFASLFYALYDDESMTLHCVNAGHNPPILLRGPGPEAGQVLRLEAGGPVVGLLPDQKWIDQTIQLRPGDLLVAFTDGLTDATSPSGEPFGEERLLDLVVRNAELEPAALQETILAEVARHAFGAPLEDDVTLIVARAVVRS